MEELGILFLQVQVKAWGGTVGLDPDDLDLKPEDVPEHIFNLGSKRLFPREEREKFRTISQKATGILRKHGLKSPIQTVYMIPKLRFPKVLEELKALHKEFWLAFQDFENKYPAMKSDWLAENEKFREKLEPAYPSVDKLRDRFKFDWFPFLIKGFNIKEMEDEALKDVIMEAQSSLEAKCDELVAESIEALRLKVNETVSNLADRIRQGKIVRNDTLGSVKNVHEWFEELNVFGDTDIQASLTKLKNIVSSIGDAAFLKDNVPLQKKILDAADEVMAHAVKLEDVSAVSGRVKRIIDLGD